MEGKNMKANNNTDKNVLSYLNIKYGESFELAGRLRQTWGMTCERWKARPASGDNDTVFTVVGIHSNEGWYFSDSYCNMLILPEYKKLINKIVGKEFENYSLSVSINKDSVNQDSLVKETALFNIKEYINEYKSILKICIKTEFIIDINERLKRVCESIAKRGFIAWVDCVTNDEKRISFVINKENKVLLLHEECAISTFINNDAVLSMWQIERLCNLVYLNAVISPEVIMLGDLMKYLLTLGLEEEKIDGNYPVEMTEGEWRVVLKDILIDPCLNSLKIVKSVDVYERGDDDILPGHRAVCFMDYADNAYIIFRGTCGDDEWEDNAEGMTLADTVQQKAALRFTEEIHKDKKLKVKSITVAGHSKGGNKAQYTAIVSNCVNRSVSFDGQGFSDAFLKKYKTNIIKRVNIIEFAAEKRDFVNCLGLPLGNTVYYKGRRGNHTPQDPYGQSLPFFHCPDALRDEKGNKGEIDDGKISRMLQIFISSFLLDSKYSNVKQSVIKNIIMLMMNSRHVSDNDLADAVANLMVLVFDLTANKKDFCDSVADVVYYEIDVLISTFNMVFGINTTESQAAEKNIALLITERLIILMLKNPVNLLNFIGFFKKLIALVKEITADLSKNPEILKYINRFIILIFETLAEKTSNIIIKLILKLWCKLLDHIVYSKTDLVFSIENADIDKICVDINNLVNEWELTLINE